MANLTVIVVLLITAAATTAAAPSPPATKYINHTVGGPTGWFFNSTANSSFTNYSSWAALQTFNLGDYLIFNTTSNQTVIETSNITTYRNCSVNNASDDDKVQYGGGSDGFGNSQVIAVPLVLEGPSYYFSGAGNGIQCQRGMAFGIQVNKGLGLPPMLVQSPPGTVAGAPPLGNVGLRGGANVCGGLFGILALLLLLRL